MAYISESTVSWTTRPKTKRPSEVRTRRRRDSSDRADMAEGERPRRSTTARRVSRDDGVARTRSQRVSSDDKEVLRRKSTTSRPKHTRRESSDVRTPGASGVDRRVETITVTRSGGTEVRRSKSTVERASASKLTRYDAVLRGDDVAFRRGTDKNVGSRSASMRDTTATASARPPLKRSVTTNRGRAQTNRAQQATHSRSAPASKLEASSQLTSERRRSSGFFSAFFGAPATPRAPERKVECLTCLADDIPRSRSAKLGCGHNMCHDCLRRIFTLSVTDPQHMPPKCCTADHIPLKHVERLFDLKFKMRWNRKYQEYTTKNRIYCPIRGCGEWIKPANITSDRSTGRKYGKCGRCKTKVCCACNGRWHARRDCPKDEETKRFVEIAKKEGWQRCHNCSAMVELKEGCNHMTCRCTAEFCMICGAKWKTCNCPWFNYDQIAAHHDQLNHMRVPQPVYRVVRNAAPQAPPQNYNDELAQRWAVEAADEALARRLQLIDLPGTDHHNNQNFLAGILTGAFDQAAAAATNAMGTGAANPIPRRRASGTAHHRPRGGGGGGPTDEAATAPPRRRQSERLVAPRREHRSARDDHEREVANHAPVGRARRSREAAVDELEEDRARSTLAGITRDRRTRGGRVGAWLRYVADGDPEAADAGAEGAVRA